MQLRFFLLYVKKKITFRPLKFKIKNPYKKHEKSKKHCNSAENI